MLVLLPPLLLAFNPTLLASHISLRSDWTFLTSTLTLLFATTQYLPQLLTTFRLKRLAGLSLFSVGVQVPVFLALGVFLALTMPVGPPAVEPPQQEGGEAALLGNSEGRHGHSRWWMVDGEQVVWMGYLVAGCVEALLLALGLHMWFWRETIQGREEAEGDEEFVVGVGVGEETPLLDGKGRDGGDLRVQEGWGEGVVRR